MASLNPFDLLAGDDNDDPSHLIAVQPQKVVAKKSPVSAEAPAAKFPSKPVPPTQAGVTVVSEGGDADKPSERGRGGYGSQRQLFRGGYGSVNGEGGTESERSPRRIYERHSGTGRGYEMKRQGAGRGNWGTTYDDLIANQLKGKDITALVVVALDVGEAEAIVDHCELRFISFSRGPWTIPRPW
ncbi:hypothetical protein GW17_00003992 [Ensete ventricosum]|nr:hypothetical protein GW17_00003992 [Ensete ventricosum]RZR79788.1 hypothetical protein BHM03_00005634 [Ensete ventricosum]